MYCCIPSLPSPQLTRLDGGLGGSAAMGLVLENGGDARLPACGSRECGVVPPSDNVLALPGPMLRRSGRRESSTQERAQRRRRPTALVRSRGCFAGPAVDGCTVSRAGAPARARHSSSPSPGQPPQRRFHLPSSNGRGGESCTSGRCKMDCCAQQRACRMRPPQTWNADSGPRRGEAPESR